MPRIEHLLFVGIGHSVVALNPRDGSEVWRVKLGRGALMNVFHDGEDLYATTKGEVFKLDPKTGSIVWHNQMKGLGMGFVTFASTRAPSGSTQQVVTEAARHAQASHAAAGAGAA